MPIFTAWSLALWSSGRPTRVTRRTMISTTNSTAIPAGVSVPTQSKPGLGERWMFDDHHGPSWPAWAAISWMSSVQVEPDAAGHVPPAWAMVGARAGPLLRAFVAATVAKVVAARADATMTGRSPRTRSARSTAVAGVAGARSGGRSATRAVSSFPVRAARACPDRWSNSSAVIRPTRKASLSSASARSRSASDTRRSPGGKSLAALSVIHAPSERIRRVSAW